MGLYIGKERFTPIEVIHTGDVNNQDKTITQNGIYTADAGYTGLGTVNVNVPQDKTEDGILFTNSGSDTNFIVKINGIKNITAKEYLFNKFYLFGSQIKEVHIDSVENISGNSAFGYTFQLCNGLTVATFSNLKYLTGSFALNYTFRKCTSLGDIYFNSLISDGFGTNSNQFDNMLSGVTGCTVHFPSNLQTTIGSWTSVAGGFGGTNTAVLFDLPATT